MKMPGRVGMLAGHDAAWNHRPVCLQLPPSPPQQPTGSSLFTVTGTRVPHTSCRSLSPRQPEYT